MNTGVEQVIYNGKILAIITRSNLLEALEKENKNLHFVSPDDFPFQVGIHNRKKDEVVKGHFHLPFSRLTNFPVQEFFYVVSGKVKFDLYPDENKANKISEVILGGGDTIILNTGHGLTFLEDAKLIELKQGPYRGRELEKKYVEDQK